MSIFILYDWQDLSYLIMIFLIATFNKMHESFNEDEAIET